MCWKWLVFWDSRGTVCKGEATGRVYVRLAAGLSVVVVVVALSQGCGGGEGVQPIEVEGNEYAFVMPDEAEGGVVRFNVSNTGKELHEYAIGRLDEGKTLDDVKEVLESGQEDPSEWFVAGGVPLLSPGEELGLTRNLEPGRYVFLCFIPSPQGVPHVELGRLQSFELTGDSGGTLPEPDAVIVANDAGYEIPELSAGEQTIELRNANDRELEFLLVALKPGTAIEDFDRFFEAGAKGLPPAQFHGAMQTIPAGTSVYIDIDLKEGVESTRQATSQSSPRSRPSSTLRGRSGGGAGIRGPAIGAQRGDLKPIQTGLEFVQRIDERRQCLRYFPSCLVEPLVSCHKSAIGTAVEMLKKSFQIELATRR